MPDAQRQLRGMRQRLNMLRLPELRNVLVGMSLQRSGRKSEIVDRIVATLENLAQKTTEGAANQAMNAYYETQLKSALDLIERETPAPRGHSSTPPPPPHLAQPVSGQYSGAPVSRYASGPPPPSAATRPLPPYNRYGVTPPHGQHPPLNGRPNGYPSAGGGAGANTGAVMTMPGGADLYKPSRAADLGDARCFCGGGGAANSGKVVSCFKCGLRVHAKCHQLITMPNPEWYCEKCRAEVFDPFYTVNRTVYEPAFVRFARSASALRIEYVLLDKDLNELYARRDPNPGAMTPGSLELQLRCFALKDDLAAGHCWPATTQLYVNSFGVPLTQRSPPGSANPSKVLRELPANIFQYSRVGRNVIELRTTDNPSLFAFSIQVVEIRNVNDLVTEITDASKNITYEAAKQEVIKSFGGDDDDDDDGIVATCTMLSIRCPLGLCVINLPARGLHCKHLQCFDLKTFLLFSRKARSKAWRCTVCHNFIKASDLRIDPYLKKLLADVAGEDELEEVEIFPDGSWKRRVEEEVQAPALKRVKTEQVDTSATSGASVEASTTLNEQAASTSGHNSSGHVEIDLISSDDEDDDITTAPTPTVPTPTAPTPAPTPTAPTPAPTVTSSTQVTTDPILLDDDLDILTVDSSVWETSTPGGTTSSDGSYFTYPSMENGMFTDPRSSSGPDSASFTRPTATATSSLDGSSWESSSVTVSPPVDLLNESEVNLANAMADLSRHHPNVSNPFERRRPQQSGATLAPPSSRTAARTVSRPVATPDPLDIIYLLDSDSD